jgi:amphiphysin
MAYAQQLSRISVFCIWLTILQLEASAKQWRDAWTNILNHQLSSVELIYAIFKPLGGEGSSSHAHAETPPAVLERVHGLHEAFAELKTDMMEEVKDIDRKLVVPAKLARDALKPMEKAIKKRDDAKVRPTLTSATSPMLTCHA